MKLKVKSLIVLIIKKKNKINKIILTHVLMMDNAKKNRDLIHVNVKVMNIFWIIVRLKGKIIIKDIFK